MKTTDVQKLYSEFVLPTYMQAPVCLVKGKGARVWDLEGKEVFGSISRMGRLRDRALPSHCGERDQGAGEKDAPRGEYFLNPKQAELARTISEASFPAGSFFCNSGAEANEGAIKFARKYGSETGRYEIITMKILFTGGRLRP